MVKVGDRAPEFEAVDCQGKAFRLSDFRGRRVVLFFFPKAFTLGCTIENRAFRDNHALIRSLGAELVGVSVDSVQRQCEFAEQENIRRRAQRELEEAVRYAASGLARDLLPTADNLRRAIESVSEELAADEPLRQMLAGVSATERALLDAFGRHGISRIDPLGEPFDPNRHQAMFEVEDAERPAGTVAEVLQPGYLHYDRLLRPAMVGVAKSPAMAEREQNGR